MTIKLNRALLIGLAGLCLTACGDHRAIKDTQGDVLAQLNDPQSAQFQNMVVNGDYVCGEVNSKNAFGGYTGFKKFYGSMKILNDKNRPADFNPTYIERDEDISADIKDMCG